MVYNPKDYYFKRAKLEEYAARSVYKLQEIQNRFQVIRCGDAVLDLGASPGSWSQFAAQIVGKNGQIIGIDLFPVSVQLSNATFLIGDIQEVNTYQRIIDAGLRLPVEVILSDMAPKTTGVKVTDQSRSFELCMVALERAKDWLKPGGNFVAKLFDSSDAMTFRDELRKIFQKVEILRPKSTRKESMEVFFIGLKKY